MNSVNQKLAAIAGALLVLSAFTYWNSVTRADRFERGQKLLPNLNPDDIAQVSISSGEDQVTLDLNGDGYLVRESNGYRARNDAVNRLIRDLLEIELAKEIGSSESLAAELGIDPPSEDAVEIALLNRSEEEMVRIRVGNADDESSGYFVRRLDGEQQEIYLTANRVNFNHTVRDFLDRQIVDVASSDIRRIEGPDFLLEREEGGRLELVEPAGEEAKSSATSKLSSFLNRLTFDQVYIGDDSEVSDLVFGQALRVDLDDKSGYIVSHAKLDERHFVKLTGYFSVDRIELAQDETDEELQEKAALLKRSDEINQFNAYHGSWVYELASFDGDKLELRGSDLVE